MPITIGSIVNGKIICPEEILQVFQNAKTKYPHMLKNPILVIDSSLIITKKSYIPVLNKRQITSAIANDFTYNANTMQELVYDAAVYKENSLNTLLSCGLEKSLLESYTNIFKRADIVLKKIDIALNAIIKYVEDFDFFPENAFIFNIIDGNNMLSLLFENGVYNFSTRYRLLNSPESPEFITELDQQLTSLIQFNIAKKSPEPIKASYYSGLNIKQLQALSEKNAPRGLKIATPNLLNDPELTSFIFPIASGMTINVKNDINLLKAEKKYGNDTATSPKKRTKQILEGILVALTIMFLGYFMFLETSSFMMHSKIDKLNTYINEPEHQQEYSEVVTNENQLSYINAEISAINQTIAETNSAKWFNSALMQDFYEAAKGEISFDNFAFTEKNQTFVIDAIATSEQAAANYVTRLKKLAFVESIDYQGYTKDDSLSQYYFHLECLLKAGENDV